MNRNKRENRRFLVWHKKQLYKQETWHSYKKISEDRVPNSLATKIATNNEISFSLSEKRSPDHTQLLRRTKNTAETLRVLADNIETKNSQDKNMNRILRRYSIWNLDKRAETRLQFIQFNKHGKNGIVWFSLGHPIRRGDQNDTERDYFECTLLHFSSCIDSRYICKKRKNVGMCKCKSQSKRLAIEKTFPFSFLLEISVGITWSLVSKPPSHLGEIEQWRKWHE